MCHSPFTPPRSADELRVLVNIRPFCVALHKRAATIDHVEKAATTLTVRLTVAVELYSTVVEAAFNRLYFRVLRVCVFFSIQVLYMYMIASRWLLLLLLAVSAKKKVTLDTFSKTLSICSTSSRLVSTLLRQFTTYASAGQQNAQTNFAPALLSGTKLAPLLTEEHN